MCTRPQRAGGERGPLLFYHIRNEGGSGCEPAARAGAGEQTLRLQRVGRVGKRAMRNLCNGLRRVWRRAPPEKKGVLSLSLSLSLSQAPPARRVRSDGGGRAKSAARPLADCHPRPPFHPRAHLSLSSRGSRHEGHDGRNPRWGEVGRGGARWGGCARARRLTARPPQTMRPSGHASTCLVTRHTSQHYELSTRA